MKYFQKVIHDEQDELDLGSIRSSPKNGIGAAIKKTKELECEV